MLNKSSENNKGYQVKVIRLSYFVRMPSNFEALWYPHRYFDRKSNI